MIIQENTFSVDEIKSFFETKGAFAHNTVFDLFKCFKMRKIFRSVITVTNTGYSLTDLFTVLILLPLMMISTVNGFISSRFELTKARKDTFYRFLNNEHLNWRNLLISFAKQFRFLTPKDDESTTPTCGIIDDTMLEKEGSKIEGIGKVFDHVRKNRVLGFKCLLYCFWDGKSIMPLDFSLHSEKGTNEKYPYGLTKKQLKARFHKDRSTDCFGYKRLKELDIDKISNAISIIKRAAKRGFIPQYILTDSWFISEKFIASIRKIRNGSMHLIGMVRQDKRKYIYHEKHYTSKELRQALRTKMKRCRKFGVYYIDVVVDYKSIGKVKLFFQRFSKRGKWQLLMTTDLSLSYIKALEIYNNRWSIEVLFKECKQHLNLGKCQSNTFDAQIAETTLSLALYTMFSFYKRIHSYETIGGLFNNLKDQMIEATIAEKLWHFMIELVLKAAELLDIDPFEKLKAAFYSDELMAFFQQLSGILPSRQNVAVIE